MKYKSVNNFEVDMENNNIAMNGEENIRIAIADASEIIGTVDETDYVDMDTVDQSRVVGTTTNFMYVITILLTFVVWIVCLVSMILNIVKKNVGKAVFSGVGLIIPFITVFIATFGRTLYEIKDTSIGVVLTGFAFIVDLIFIILSFIFCFSKNKNRA